MKNNMYLCPRKKNKRGSTLIRGGAWGVRGVRGASSRWSCVSRLPSKRSFQTFFRTRVLSRWHPSPYRIMCLLFLFLPFNYFNRLYPALGADFQYMNGLSKLNQTRQGRKGGVVEFHCKDTVLSDSNREAHFEVHTGETDTTHVVLVQTSKDNHSGSDARVFVTFVGFKEDGVTESNSPELPLEQPLGECEITTSTVHHESALERTLMGCTIPR